MKKAIFITVRTNSTRLPQKCLLKIGGLTTIQHLIRRVKKSRSADLIILCTTELKQDDVLCEIAKKEGIECFKGKEKDKLERWKGAAEKYDIEFFVSVDGDDIFCEPELIDLAFKQYLQDKPDFIKGDGVEGVDVPCGAFTYAIKTEALDKACQIKDSDDTEMMWTYFEDTGLFDCQILKNVPAYYKSPDIRMTLDYPEDLEFFKSVFKGLQKEGEYFNLKDIIQYLEKHPEIVRINQFLQERFRANQKEKTKLILKNGRRTAK